MATFHCIESLFIQFWLSEKLLCNVQLSTRFSLHCVSHGHSFLYPEVSCVANIFSHLWHALISFNISNMKQKFKFKVTTEKEKIFFAFVEIFGDGGFSMCWKNGSAVKTIHSSLFLQGLWAQFSQRHDSSRLSNSSDKDLFLFCVCLSTCTYVHYLHADSLEGRRARFLGTRMTQGSKQQHGCWELCLCTLEGSQCPKSLPISPALGVIC